MPKNVIMAANASPDNVTMPSALWLAKFERSAPIRRPSHLPDAAVGSHLLDAESRLYALIAQTLYEALDGDSRSRFLIAR
jgi:hypothetical protein